MMYHWNTDPTRMPVLAKGAWYRRRRGGRIRIGDVRMVGHERRMYVLEGEDGQVLGEQNDFAVLNTLDLRCPCEAAHNDDACWCACHTGGAPAAAAVPAGVQLELFR